IVDQDGFSQLDWAEAPGAGTSALVVWQAPADGTYYLQVSSGDGQSTGAYSVSATPTSLSVTNPVDGSGSQFAVVGPDNGGPVQLFFGGGRIFASVGASIGLDAPVALGLASPAAGNVPVPAATHDASTGGVASTSAVAVQQNSSAVTDLANAKATAGLFASPSVSIDSPDLLHKPDNLLGSENPLL
ncbi:MAG: hypothetical protein ABSH20_10560, partial [Tepidisphaeraceae bacterium]